MSSCAPTSSRPAPTAGPSASSSPTRGEFAAHVLLRGDQNISPKADPSVIMGRRLDRRRADRGGSISRTARASSSARCSTPKSRSCATGAAFPTAPAAARRPRSATRRNSAARSSRSSPASSGRRSRFREKHPRPDALDAHHADRRRRADDRGIAEEVVRRRHRRLRHRLEHDHQGACSTPRTTRASKRTSGRPIALTDKIKAELAGKK